MKKRKNKKNKYGKAKRIGAAVVSSLVILAITFAGLKEYRIRKCVSSTLEDLEAVLGPCPPAIKDKVLANLRTYCERIIEDGSSQ